MPSKPAQHLPQNNNNNQHGWVEGENLLGTWDWTKYKVYSPINKSVERNLDRAVANFIGDGQCDRIKVAQGCTVITLLRLCALTKERDTIVGKRERWFMGRSV